MVEIPVFNFYGVMSPDFRPTAYCIIFAASKVGIGMLDNAPIGRGISNYPEI